MSVEYPPRKIFDSEFLKCPEIFALKKKEIRSLNFCFHFVMNFKLLPITLLIC